MREVTASSLDGVQGPWHAVVRGGIYDATHTACGRDLVDETHHLNRWDYAAHPEHDTITCKACLHLHPPTLEPYR